MSLRGSLRLLSIPGLFFLLVGVYLLMESFSASIGLLLSMPLTGAGDLKGVQDIIFHPSEADLNDPAVLFAIKLINILVSGGKLLAGLFFLHLIQGHPVARVGLDRRPAWLMMGLAVAAMVAASPLIDWLNSLNQNLSFSGSWAETAREWEDQAARLTTAILRPASPLESITTFFMVAIMAAVWEEIIFRGLLQRLLEAGTRNGHLAVWLTALIFTAIHFQFYSFLPRLVLGLVLGYLFWWSRNLWVPMLAHFLNNAVYVLYSWYAGPEAASAIGNPSWIAAMVGLILLTAVLYGVYRSRDRTEPAPWEGLLPGSGRLPFEPPADERPEDRS